MPDESNTRGRVGPRLRELGYEPGSLLAHRFGGSHDDLLAADDPAAVLCWPEDVGRRLCVLVTATQVEARRSAIAKAFERRQYPGPVRVGSDGSEWRPFQLHCHEALPELSTSDRALLLLSAEWLGPGNGLRSRAIPIAGRWQNGSLLDVPRERLPVFDEKVFERLFEECQPAIQHVELPKYIPTPPTPAELEEERECAMLRKNPRALVARLEELRGEGAQQVAVRMSLLRAVARTGDDDEAAKRWLAQALRTKAA